MAETRKSKDPTKENNITTTHRKPQLEAQSSPSRRALRSFFSCRYKKSAEEKKGNEMVKDKSTEVSKRRASISGCKVPLREINNRVVSKSLSSHSTSTLTASSSSSSVGGSFRVMHLRRLSGCYECQMVIDPNTGVFRDPSLRATIFTCSDCGEIFVKSENLELHQSIRHAVSELGPEDTSRNIVEIIFQSSWLQKQAAVCKIDRILKVHNTKSTISSFEEYREYIKIKATKFAKKLPRCVADGNELLRFHCTTFTCSLGLNGSTNLCDSIPECKVCSIIRDGIKIDELGRILTLATSGRAHDAAHLPTDGEKRAMLVCRVIAGRVKKNADALDEFDSVAGKAEIYPNLDELFVFNPKAILPCFVVIYRDC